MYGSEMEATEISRRLREAVFLYNDHWVDHFKLEPVRERCEPGWFRSCREHLLLQNCYQFVFVRRGTEAAGRVRALRGGGFNVHTNHGSAKGVDQPHQL
jgi:hypothetical protein